MAKISVAMDDEDFWQFIHTYAQEYAFPGGYSMFRRSDTLWCITDSIGHCLNDHGIWIGQPREEDKLVNWLTDTGHEFKDAWELFQRATGTIRPVAHRSS